MILGRVTRTDYNFEIFPKLFPDSRNFVRLARNNRQPNYYFNFFFFFYTEQTFYFQHKRIRIINCVCTFSKMYILKAFCNIRLTVPTN